MKSRLYPIVVTAALALAACGGGDDASDAVDPDDDTESVETDDTSGGGVGGGGGGDSDELDLPFSSSSFDRVCSTQVGFGDAAAYDASTPGPHPIVLFSQSEDDDTFFASLSDLPAGWRAEDDDNFDDNGELAVTELIACNQIVERTPTGIMCELELDDDSVVTLEIVDLVYSMKIYEAQTGALVGETPIEATSTDCPSFTFVDDGQTQYFNKASEDQILNAIKDFVVPGGPVSDPTELPQFDTDFARVCNTQIGFGGATPLAAGPGPHPVILFQESDDTGAFVESVADLPADWRIDGDSDFEDNSELQPLELVACSAIVERIDTGTVCEVEDDDGVTTQLNLIDLTYEVTVYEATTGAVVGTEIVQSVWSDCPSFVFIDEGQTEYTQSPNEEDYINALAPYVTPA